jgi:hypothetical protein
MKITPLNKDMRKLIIGASIILILISSYDLLKAVFASPQTKSASPIAVAVTPTPVPDKLFATTTPAPDSTFTLEPLKSRVVEHQPDQFRQGAISGEELSAIKKAIETIPWSRNANPKSAANEDYAAILKECEKSSVHGLLTDLLTEAVSNDYQPNQEAANDAYSTELNADFERNEQSGSSKEESTAEVPAEKGMSVNGGLPPAADKPQVPANATSLSPAKPPTPPAAVRSKIGHVKHRSIERHQIVDVKVRLIELWHQSLAQTAKSPQRKLFPNSHEGALKSRVTPSDTPR